MDSPGKYPELDSFSGLEMGFLKGVWLGLCEVWKSQSLFLYHPQGPEHLPKHAVPFPRLAQASPSSQNTIRLYFLSWFPFKHRRSGSHLLSMETINFSLGNFPFLSVSCESGWLGEFIFVFRLILILSVGLLLF